MNGPREFLSFRRIPWGAALAAIAAAALCAFLLLDADPPAGWQDRKVIIPRGSSLPQMVTALKEGGVLRLRLFLPADQTNVSLPTQEMTIL